MCPAAHLLCAGFDNGFATGRSLDRGVARHDAITILTSSLCPLILPEVHISLLVAENRRASLRRTANSLRYCPGVIFNMSFVLFLEYTTGTCGISRYRRCFRACLSTSTKSSPDEARSHRRSHALRLGSTPGCLKQRWHRGDPSTAAYRRDCLRSTRRKPALSFCEGTRTP